MIIRTISQLPKTTTIDDSDSLFEVSIKRDQSYISKAITYGNLMDKLYGEIDNKFQTQYGLNPTINIDSIKNTVNSLTNGNIAIKGVKNMISSTVQLSTLPYDNNKLEDESYRNTAASIGYVLNAMKSGSSFISNGSKATGFVTTGGMRYQAETGGLMQFYFNENTAARTSEECICPQSGNLVMYGWLADNGNVDPAAAWVAVEAYSDTILEGGGWIIVALQPWIQGTKHSNLQYVGFNIPVAKGMKLRITTGFDLNYTNSTYQQRKNTLVMNVNTASAMNITNSFIGYVLY